MSSPAKNEFLCIIPDKPGARSARIEIRPNHLANLKPLVESGIIVAGGATFEGKHPAEGETPQFNGSAVIVMGESIDQVRELLSKDIYAEKGVWDMDRMQVLPFKSAVRSPITN